MRILRRKLRRDMRRQRAQFGAVVLTVFLGVSLFGASYDAFRNLERSYEAAFERYRFANLVVTGGRVGELADRAEALRGVAAVETRVEADVPFRVGGDKLLGRAVGIPPGEQPEVNRLDLQAGRYPEARARVLVDQHMADAFDLAPGDRFALRGPGGPVAVRVAGVAASPEYYWPARSRQDLLPGPQDFGVAYVPEPTAQRLAGLEGPNQAVVYYREGAADENLTRDLTGLAERLGAAGVLTRADQPSNSALQQDLDAFEQLAFLFPLLFLTAAGMATSVLLARLVDSQRPVIGMLRASGFSRAAVTRHFVAFGMVAGLVGAIPGVAAGVLLGSQIADLYTSELSIPVTVVEVSPVTLAIGVAFGVLLGLAAAAIPARRAARVAPAEAMRRMVAARGGGSSLPERVLPPLRRLPARWKMALRGPGRNRRRTLYTALGVVLALTLVLVSWGMVDTAQILVERQFETIQREDARLGFATPLDAERLHRLRETPGVARAEVAAELSVSLQANGRRYRTQLRALPRDTELHTFLGEDGERRELPADGLLAGAALRSELGVDPGEPITIVVATTGERLRVPIAGFVDEPLGTYAYSSLEALRAAAGERLGTVALVRYTAGVDPERMERRLSALPGIVAFEDTKALYRTVDDYLGLYYLFVGVMLVFGAAMAFALLFAAMSTNVAERTIEVATLRAAGLGRGELARIVGAENVVVAALGIPPGLLVGHEVARLFMASFSSDQFSFDLETRASTLALSALAMLAVAALSLWPGLRAINRLDVASVVRERAA